MRKGDGILTDIRVAETLRVEVPSPDGPTFIAITLMAKSGQVARLRVQAPENVSVKTGKTKRDGLDSAESPCMIANA